MNQEKVKLGSLEGLGDDPRAIREINDRLKEMMEEAPSDASAELIVRRVGHGFKGFLKVCSSQRKFIGGSAGPKLFEVVNSIFDEVRSQIRTWKRTRFVGAGSMD